MNNEFSKTEYMLSVEEGLVIDENNMVSSKDLYKFLGLSEQNYARWCDRNIRNNEALEEGIDYKAIVYATLPSEERMDTGVQPNFSQEYLLQADIAQELAMESHTKQGRVVRDFFRKALGVSIQQYNELFKTTTMLAERVEQLGKLTQDSNKEIMARLDVLESSSTVANDEETEWAREMQPRVNALAECYTHGDSGKCIDRLIERAEELGMPDSYEELKAYYAAHHDGKRAKKILIMAQFEESREPFERALKEKEKEWGLYKQNEGQKYLEKMMDGFGIEIVPDPPEYHHEMTDAECEAQYEAMTKMYGEGWDAPQNYPPDDAARDY